MDQASLESTLADLHLPAIRYFDHLDSTNDEAWRWVESGALHGALVVADEQTAGRGRLHRRWVTVYGSSLAFSLVLLAPPLTPAQFTRLTGLGALSTCQALANLYSLPALVKWPNDILLEQRKTGGVLVESRWSGDQLSAVVLGIGINIAPSSISPEHLPPAPLSMPVTCVEDSLGQVVDRLELLHGILQQLLSWLPRLASPEFIQAWESRLAYRQQWVEVTPGAEVQPASLEAAQPGVTVGKVIGLSQDGSLELSTQAGKRVTVQAGEIRLRPIDAPPG